MRAEDHRRDLTRDSRLGLIHSSVPEERVYLYLCKTRAQKIFKPVPSSPSQPSFMGHEARKGQSLSLTIQSRNVCFYHAKRYLPPAHSYFCSSRDLPYDVLEEFNSTLQEYAIIRWQAMIRLCVPLLGFWNYMCEMECTTKRSS